MDNDLGEIKASLPGSPKTKRAPSMSSLNLEVTRSPKFGGLSSRGSSKHNIKLNSSKNSSSGTPNVADTDSAGSNKIKAMHKRKNSEKGRRSAFFGANNELSDATSSRSSNQEAEELSPVRIFADQEKKKP